MLGTQRIINFALLFIAISFSSCSSNGEGNFLWRLFSKGKSFIFGVKDRNRYKQYLMITSIFGIIF
jgi:hypothetical protein